jgi:hypothetical protein
MRGAWRLTVIGAVLLAGSAGGQATSATPPEMQQQQGAPTMEQKTWGPAPTPLLSVLGLPVVAGAPVAPPYRSGFQNFEGQPEAGRDAAAALGG